MDLQTIRTLNKVGSILFGILGSFIPILYSGIFGFILFMEGGGFAMVCITIMIVWLFFIIFMAYMLYQKTVVALDRGEYDTVKTWMIGGAILGFIFGGGIITLAIFLIAYVSFNDALYPKYYYPPPPGAYGYPPPPAPPPGYHYYHGYPPPPPYYYQQPQPQKSMKDPEVKSVRTYSRTARPETPRRK